MTIAKDINDEALTRLSMDDALEMVDVYGDNNCHHRPGDVLYGDPTYYLERCSSCWRAVWPLVLLADARFDFVVRAELNKVVNGTLDAAIDTLRERWYVTDSGMRMPSLQDQQREDALDELRLRS